MLALLGDPNRRRLYDLVVSASAPMGKDDAAAALGMSRELAAFHLDRLVAAGLLQADFRRRTGRSGPGAGRPAKLYRRTPTEIAISLPPRAYDRAAELFAGALDGLDGAVVGEAVSTVARERGADLGSRARRDAGPRPGASRLKAALFDLLEASGFEPEVDPSLGSIRLRNCPYRVLSERHRELTCGMNLAWASGVVEGLKAPRLAVELRPQESRCCVVFGEPGG
jgi:predicted ArsR family transcriptional regulator